jgi:hypothetical protein
MRRERPVTSATSPCRSAGRSGRARRAPAAASELFDQLVAARDGFAAFDGLAVAIDRPRRQIAFAVGEGLVELHREGMGEVVENIFFAVAVYVERGGRRRRFPSVFHDFTPDNI